MSFTRDRRLGGSRDGPMDPESLERDNDRGLDLLSERIGLLKQATHGIRNEADSQHSILDRMADGMVGTRGLLSGANEKFRQVMNDKRNRQLLTMVVGIVVLLLLLYYFVWK